MEECEEKVTISRRRVVRYSFFGFIVEVKIEFKTFLQLLFLGKKGLHVFGIFYLQSLLSDK